MTWRDAYFDYELDTEKRDRADYLVETTGYLLPGDDLFVSIAAERLPSGDGWRSITHIPKENVVKREVLSTGTFNVYTTTTA